MCRLAGVIQKQWALLPEFIFDIYFFLFNWQTVAGWVLFIFTGMLRVRLCQTDTKHGYLVQWNRKAAAGLRDRSKT